MKHEGREYSYVYIDTQIDWLIDYKTVIGYEFE